MAELVRLNDHRRSKGRRVTFDRQELRQLLDVYSRRVASGEWKDYAIDLRHGVAVFSIFRHTFDLPVFTVAKRSSGGLHCEYLLFSGREQIKHGKSIGEVLAIFNRPLRLISHR
jgi:hypothetical protein